MAAVTANQLIKARNPGSLVAIPAAAERLYAGTMAFYNATTGFATGDDNGGANHFAGIVKDDTDNSGGSAGDLSVECYQDGEFELVGSSFVQADAGDKAYAIDNFTIQKSATTATFVGRITEFVSATKLMVKLAVGIV